MKSPGTPLCGGMAGGGPADLARAPSVPPNISKKSGSQSHKNWRFNFQVNHFVGFCCFLSHLKVNIFSSNVASCSLHWNIYNMWNLVLSHLVPKLLRWFQKKYEATVCQRKITTNWNIDDRWSEPVLNQNRWKKQTCLQWFTYFGCPNAFSNPLTLRGHPQHHLSTCPISNKNPWTDIDRSSLDTTVLSNFDTFSVCFHLSKKRVFHRQTCWNHGRSGSDAWYPWLAWSWCLRWRPHHPVTLGEVEM